MSICTREKVTHRSKTRWQREPLTVSPSDLISLQPLNLLIAMPIWCSMLDHGVLDLNDRKFHENNHSEVQFCLLAYRPQNCALRSSRAASVILLVVLEQSGSLRFLVDPNFREIVRGEDLPYLESLLKDFSRRARLHPAALFIQLSQLEVGPLVTQDAGSSLSEHPAVMELLTRFVELQ